MSYETKIAKELFDKYINIIESELELYTSEITKLARRLAIEEAKDKCSGSASDVADLINKLEY